MTQRRIYSFISRTAIISMLLLLATTATAKKKQAAKGKANTTVKADSIPFLRGVAVSADMIGLAEMALGSHGQYEAQLRVNLKDKYFPVVEIGYGTADADEITTGLKYKTSAPYARVGMDFNIARNKHDDYRIYVGARYAMTDYKFDVSSDVIKDPVWGDEVEYEGKDIKANCHWLEAVFGVDAKIWGPLRLGWSARWRKRIAHDNGTMGNTWYVPGFGKQAASKLAGTFNVTFEF